MSMSASIWILEIYVKYLIKNLENLIMVLSSLYDNKPDQATGHIGENYVTNFPKRCDTEHLCIYLR